MDNLAEVDQWIDGVAPAKREFALRMIRTTQVSIQGLVQRCGSPSCMGYEEELLRDFAAIEQYRDRDPQAMRERLACLPAFPKKIRLPTKTGKRSRLRVPSSEAATLNFVR